MRRMDPAALLDRILAIPRIAFVRAVLDAYGHAAGGLLANGLAFSALFALVPTTLLILGLTGLIVGNPETSQALVDALGAAFPPLKELLQSILDSVSQAAALTSLIGLIGLIWSVSQFHGALDVAFARIFADAPERDIVRRTARGFVWVAILLGLVVTAIVVGAIATFLDALVPGAMPVAGTVASLVTSPLVLLMISVAVMLLLYRTMPPQAVSWAAVRPPAIVVGVVLVGLGQVFSFLAPRLVGSAALVGSLATAFIALAWLSFSFQAVLYGAAWVSVRAKAMSALGGPAASTEPGGGGE